tara:strand:- start:222 stop:395 length:174 start_codon:yes stop_codon:yes gene_type:complete
MEKFIIGRDVRNVYATAIITEYRYGNNEGMLKKSLVKSADLKVRLLKCSMYFILMEI